MERQAAGADGCSSRFGHARAGARPWAKARRVRTRERVDACCGDVRSRGYCMYNQIGHRNRRLNQGQQKESIKAVMRRSGRDRDGGKRTARG